MILDKTLDQERRQRLKKERHEAQARRREALAKDPRVLAAKRAQKERRHAAYEVAKARRRELVREQKGRRRELEAEERTLRDASILRTVRASGSAGSTGSTGSTGSVDPTAVSNVLAFPTARSKRTDQTSR
jgi:hypothetical protein